MTDEENNKRSAEIETIKEKFLLEIDEDLRKKAKGILNTITALSHHWGYKEGYDNGWKKAKEGTTCRSCEQWTTCEFTEEGKCDEYKKKSRRK